MHAFRLLFAIALCCFSVTSVFETRSSAQETSEGIPELRVGIIGLDTSHATAFTRLLNADHPSDALAGCRVVAAYPHGSPDIESSVSRIPRYTEEVQGMGVEIVESIDELVSKVDCVLLETNDGRPHLEQVVPVFAAGKPVFIDKPIAASLVDAYAIFLLAEYFETPVFSSSSLRFSSGVQSIRSGAVGDVLGVDAYSPCALEATHPDLYWYGIHGVEMLFTAMGEGCESVSRTHTDAFDQVTGTWSDGRIGTFRGMRNGKTGYGGTAYGSEAIASLGQYDGYEPLVREIVSFFRGGPAPVAPDETLDIYAFMTAADVSKNAGGSPVRLDHVKQEARRQAEQKVKLILASLSTQTEPERR